MLEIAFADGDLLWTQGRHEDTDMGPLIIKPTVMLSRPSDPAPVEIVRAGHEVSIAYGRIAWDADPTPEDADGSLYGLRIFTSASTPLAPLTLGRAPELPVQANVEPTVVGPDLVAWYERDIVDPEGDTQLFDWILAQSPSTGETRVVAKSAGYSQIDAGSDWLIWASGGPPDLYGVRVADIQAAWH